MDTLLNEPCSPKFPLKSGNQVYQCGRTQWCIAARAADKPHWREQQAATDEAVPRIELDFAELDHSSPIPSLNAVNIGSESLSATLCPTRAFSEYLVEAILAFVEALRHNVVLLHSDQEPVLVQLLRTVQSRRTKRALVRHGPSGSNNDWSAERCGCHSKISCGRR